MNKRRLSLGDSNISGERITEARKHKNMTQVELIAKMQVKGIDISTTAFSQLEGQKRPATDIELKAISEILDVSMDWLAKNKRKNN